MFMPLLVRIITTVPQQLEYDNITYLVPCIRLVVEIEAHYYRLYKKMLLPIR